MQPPEDDSPQFSSLPHLVHCETAAMLFSRLVRAGNDALGLGLVHSAHTPNRIYICACYIRCVCVNVFESVHATYLVFVFMYLNLCMLHTLCLCLCI